MKRYRVLIVGAGNQGALSDAPGSNNWNKIISYAHAFKNYGGFDLLGFVDNDFRKAEHAKTIWNCEFSSNTFAKGFINLDVDIVVIATPDSEHFDLLKTAVKYNPKLVIVEKPICDNLNEAKEIIELYKTKAIPLMVNYTRQYLPYYDYLKQCGKPIYATCAYNRGLLHTGSHAVDFFNMLGVDNYRLIKIPTEAYRVWDVKVYYKNYIFSETRVGNMPVWNYYDKTHWHVIKNAYNFLEGKEELKCTGKMALETLEKCFEIEGAKLCQ